MGKNTLHCGEIAQTTFNSRVCVAKYVAGYALFAIFVQFVQAGIAVLHELHHLIEWIEEIDASRVLLVEMLVEF